MNSGFTPAENPVELHTAKDAPHPATASKNDDQITTERALDTQPLRRTAVNPLRVQGTGSVGAAPPRRGPDRVRSNTLDPRLRNRYPRVTLRSRLALGPNGHSGDSRT